MLAHHMDAAVYACLKNHNRKWICFITYVFSQLLSNSTHGRSPNSDVFSEVVTRFVSKMEVAYDCVLVAIDTWRVDQTKNKCVKNSFAKGRHVELLGYQMVPVMGGMLRLLPTRFRAIRRVSTCRCGAWYFCSHPTRRAFVRTKRSRPRACEFAEQIRRSRNQFRRYGPSSFPLTSLSHNALTLEGDIRESFICQRGISH